MRDNARTASDFVHVGEQEICIGATTLVIDREFGERWVIDGLDYEDAQYHAKFLDEAIMQLLLADILQEYVADGVELILRASSLGAASLIVTGRLTGQDLTAAGVRVVHGPDGAELHLPEPIVVQGHRFGLVVVVSDHIPDFELYGSTQGVPPTYIPANWS